MTKPATVKILNAQRQDRLSATVAPSKGPLNAATPQMADMMPNNCGQMRGGKRRSTDTKASATSAPPPSPSTKRPARKIGIVGAAAHIIAPVENRQAAIITFSRSGMYVISRPADAPATIAPSS